MPIFQPQPKAILFDLDGTLADTAPDLGGAINIMRQKRAMPALPIADLRQMASSGSRGLLASGFNLTPEDANFAEYQAEFLDIYRKNLVEDTVFFDGVADVIHTLAKKNIAWGVVTNKAKRFTDPLMAELEKRYDLPKSAVIVSGDTTAHAKPHPAPMQYALEGLHLSAADVVYVGDDLRDIQAAQAVNMRSVAALYGYLGEHAPDLWGADEVIYAPLELLNFLA